MWQQKEVETSDQQGGEHDASGQEDPKLEMIVIGGSAMMDPHRCNTRLSLEGFILRATSPSPA